MLLETTKVKDGTKALSKERLIELLSALPDGSLLVSTGLGNLVVLNADADYIGFIDFAFEGESCL